MKKTPAKMDVQPAAHAPTLPQPIGSSHAYKIEKYGMYQYQLVRLDGEAVTPVGIPNTYQVVASELTDRLLDEINKGNK